MKNSGSEEDAKDIFQNAVLALYKNIIKPEFELSAKLSTYLFSISKNLWLKQIRDASKKQTLPLTMDIEQEEGDNSGNEVLIDKMSKAFEKLSANCQKLIRLYHYESRNWKEITELMTYKNEHAARNQKYKCLQKIKNLLIR